jgi:hypothetical protein
MGQWTASAVAPKMTLRHMIDDDMKGDASARLDLATKSTSVNMPLCNQMFTGGSIAYMLDDGGMQIATSWRFDDDNYPCSDAVCTLGVIYRVVGTSKGCYSPSWKSKEAWYVVPLPQPMERTVKYTFWHINGAWKIKRFPAPYVSKDAMKAFFLDEMKAMTKVQLASPPAEDPRATKNTQVILAWIQQQLDLIEKLPN